MLASNVEYITLRLIRKFVLNERFMRTFASYIPYYLPSQGEITPVPVIDQYERGLESQQRSIKSKIVLEIGSGHTNSTGYEIAARGANKVYCLEPFMKLDAGLDSKMLVDVSRRHGVKSQVLAGAVLRTPSLETLPDETVDVVLSHSVLEHVDRPEELLQGLRRILKPDGCMLHIVDYRDHFFKYPFHFLQFSKNTWDRYLNPGDMPRWRLSDHLRMFKASQLSVIVLERQQDSVAFNQIKSHIAADFDAQDSTLDTTIATLFARKQI